MNLYKADLHIHTCLSPCADIDISPLRIIRAAKERNLDIVGICDHNSGENVAAAKRAAEREGVVVIGGMEITSAEEVHLLALFTDDAALLAMQTLVYAHLPDDQNNARRFGDQVVANEDDEVVDFNTRLLIGATTLSIETLVKEIHTLNGLAIAAHIDREGFGIIGQLGFIPPGLALDAVEVSYRGTIMEFCDQGFPIITSSDAHRLEDIGRSSTQFLLEAATLPEIRKALNGEDRRNCSGAKVSQGTSTGIECKEDVKERRHS